MKQNLFKKMMVRGAIMMASALVFNSCGNADNALEEIIKGANVSPTAFKKWNATTGQWETIDLANVDYKKLTAELVAGNGNVLEAGKYLVQGSVTINNNIMGGGDGKLEFYLSDDAQLTINGTLDYDDSPEGIEIHGQTNGTGQLVINSLTGPGINAKNIVIDGGELRAKSTIEDAVKTITFISAGGHIEAITDANGKNGVEGKVEIGGGTALFQGGESGMACTKYARSANYQRNINLYVSHDGVNWNDHDELAPGEDRNCADRYLKAKFHDL